MPEGESALASRLIELLEPVVMDYGLELVELQFRREMSGWVLRLTVDSLDDGDNGDDAGVSGVGINDCAQISREVASILEVEDLIKQAYHLEVSSPGLDRPLKRERDFVRCRGKLAKIVSQEIIDGQNVFIGRLGELVNGEITLACDSGLTRIPLAVISRANLVVEW
ncbi:MAG: ribosome maturation factor RimP [Desulfobulbaceae bacterium]|nr:MAG: ribosome maturation factor RimP [Desulfobulbaceae bacterium]